MHANHNFCLVSPRSVLLALEDNLALKRAGKLPLIVAAAVVRAGRRYYTTAVLQPHPSPALDRFPALLEALAEVNSRAATTGVLPEDFVHAPAPARHRTRPVSLSSQP